MSFEQTSQRIEQLLREAASVRLPSQPKQYRLSESARVQLNRVLDQKFPRVKSLTNAEMKGLVLKILTKRAMDGFQLAKALEKAQLKLQDAEEGAIYGLLASLESAGMLEGRWRTGADHMTKTYHITEKGSDLLERTEAVTPGEEIWVRSVLAVTN